MEAILKTLGGVAIGVAAYTLGEIVQERRTQRGEEYGILDLIDEWIDELGEEGTKEKIRVEERG